MNSNIPNLPEELIPYPIIAYLDFSQGPIFDKQGNFYFGGYVKDGTIGRMTLDGTVEVWAHVGGQVNGLKVDGYGNILVADVGGNNGMDGHARVSRIHPVTRQLEVLTDNYEGVPYRGIYDVCLDSSGNIYFADPRCGTPEHLSGKKNCPCNDIENPTGAVYMIDMDTNNNPRKVTRVADKLAYPNGMAFYPGDESRFFVGEMKTNRLLEYKRLPDGTLKDKRTVFEFPNSSLSGFRFDEYCRLWTSRFPRSTVDVLDVDKGELLASYDAGGDGVSNVCFWDKSLYVCVSGRHSIHRLDVGVRGAPVIP